MLADVVSLALALALTVGLYGNQPSAGLRVGALVLAAFPVILAKHRLYSSRFVTRGPDEVRRLVHSCVIATGVLVTTATALNTSLPRGWIITWLVSSLALLLAERLVARGVFKRLRHGGWMLRPVVVVGSNSEAGALCAMFEADPTLGYRTVGVVSDVASHTLEYPHYGPVEAALAAVHATGATGVVIATTAVDLASSNRLIRELTDEGVHVELSSTLRDIASHRLTVRPLGRFPVVYIEPVRRHGWRRVAKRAFDVAVAGALLVTVLPVLAVAALLIKLDSPGPVLFRQRRVGRDGGAFEVLKLRTMVVDAEERLEALRAMNEADGPLFKMAEDPRVTRVGRLLRRSSIDELPQLWNVLRNEMSMVGPRPALPAELPSWSEALQGRLRVQPGITGMWQVSGRSSTTFDDYERLDLYYVDNWSLVTDLAILAKTVPAVLGARGAH